MKVKGIVFSVIIALALLGYFGYQRYQRYALNQERIKELDEIIAKNESEREIVLGRFENEIKKLDEEEKRMRNEIAIESKVFGIWRSCSNNEAMTRTDTIIYCEFFPTYMELIGAARNGKFSCILKNDEIHLIDTSDPLDIKFEFIDDGVAQISRDGFEPLTLYKIDEYPRKTNLSEIYGLWEPLPFHKKKYNGINSLSISSDKLNGKKVMFDVQQDGTVMVSFPKSRL